MDLSTSVTIIGWFVQVLLDQGITFAIDHWGGGAAGDPDLPGALESLRAAMNNVCAFLPLAQGNRSENTGVQLWFKDLKAAAYDAEDLLSELDYYRIEKQVEGEDNSKSSTFGDSLIETTTGFFSNLLITGDNQASTSSPLPSSHDSESTIVPRISKVVLRLKHIFTELSTVLNLPNPENCRPIQHVFPEASHRTTTSFAPLKEKKTWIGRDSEKDQIITSLLRPAAASVCVVPIVGMGGVGKTTLAKMVYNDEQIKKHFDKRIWVCVSDDFDVARLTREILQGLDVKGWEHLTNLNKLQELLEEKLQSVRYLLVLDDVWNESEREKWGSLCAPLVSEKSGSRILMTTRQNNVVSTAAKNIDMLRPCPLKGLPEDQYLKLFNTYAFGDPNPSHHPILVKIGEQIAGRLKGSPLAAKTVGSLLRESLYEDHWRRVLNSPIWQLPQSKDDITPALQLSYQHLRPHLQQCFIYCSVFPKDRQFEKDEMVGMWISQGYVHAKSIGNKTLEEIGSEYFDNLLSRSFIQEGSYRRYVLHDLLHDVAESVSENEYLKINSKQRKEITSSVRHLHVHSNDLSFLQSCKLGNLRTLIIDGDESDDYSVLKEVLDGLKSMRVLILNYVTEQLLSASIGHLTHLRYLAVYCKKSGESLVSGEGASALPAATNSMVSLRPYHLQWLISGKGGLALPAAAKYLVSLRHFGSIMGSRFDMWNEIASLSGIGNLTCLQELERFAVEKSEGRKLAELKRLNELKGTLELRSLNNASTKEEALEANLNKKVGIRKLVLDCGDGHATPHMAEEVFEGLCPPPEVFEGLCPPPCIKELTLDTYLGVESPTWMMMTENSCLLFLQSLVLVDCRNWKVLPPLGQLPLLRLLWISNANAVEEIGSSFYGSGVVKSFPCLETLKFKDMPEWVVWSGVEKDTDSLLPRLRELTVMNCPKLKGVPMQCLASVEKLKTNCMVLLGELEKLTSLKELDVIDCKEMQSLPLLPASLVYLNIYDCHELSSVFTTQTETQTKLPSLREIVIYDCGELVSVELKSLPSLRKITIKSCDKLVSVEVKSLPSLEKLEIGDCGTIQSVPLLPATLAELVIISCKMITAFSGEQEDDLSDLTSLKEIMCDCPRLRVLPFMPASLQQLHIRNCPQLRSLPSMPASLQQLHIENCPQLRSLPSMPASLQQLFIRNCSQLHSLPPMPASLQQLIIAECLELPRERYQEGGDDWHKISHVPDIRWLDWF